MTILLVAWGQFLDHDITLSAETRDPRTGKTPKCCDGSGPGPVHPNCLPIEIPAEDGFFSKHGQRCMNFVRTISGLRYNCRLGPRQSFNEISSIIDAGTVYSNSAKTMEELRTFKGGLLKVSSSTGTQGEKYEYSFLHLFSKIILRVDRAFLVTNSSFARFAKTI